MYFPRGYVHYARTHNLASIHITFSTFQAASIGTFLQFLLKHLIYLSLKKDFIFRKHVPVSSICKLGNLIKLKDFHMRKQFIRILCKHIIRLGNYLEKAIVKTASEINVGFTVKRLKSLSIRKSSNDVVFQIKKTSLIRCISPLLFCVMDRDNPFKKKKNIYPTTFNDCFTINDLEERKQLKEQEKDDFFFNP